MAEPHDILIALIVTLPPTLTALGALLITWRQNRTLEATQAGVNDVHLLVNSQLTTLKADLAIANQRIADLMMLIDQRTP